MRPAPGPAAAVIILMVMNVSVVAMVWRVERTKRSRNAGGHAPERPAQAMTQEEELVIEILNPAEAAEAGRTGCRTAHSEHTIAITESGAQILTSPSRA